MARSSADDMELKRGCEAGILAKGDRDKVVMAMRVAKGRGGWGKAGKLTSRHMAKPRVLAITSQYPFSIASPVLHPCALMGSFPDRPTSPPVDGAAKQKGQKTKAFMRVLKYSNGGVLEVIFLLPFSMCPVLSDCFSRLDSYRCG